jgi:collagenase-like PrtC family protease
MHRSELKNPEGKAIKFLRQEYAMKTIISAELNLTKTNTIHEKNIPAAVNTHANTCTKQSFCCF